MPTINASGTLQAAAVWFAVQANAKGSESRTAAITHAKIPEIRFVPANVAYARTNGQEAAPK
jgi:hypothetical protein